MYRLQQAVGSGLYIELPELYATLDGASKAFNADKGRGFNVRIIRLRDWSSRFDAGSPQAPRA